VRDGQPVKRTVEVTSSRPRVRAAGVVQRRLGNKRDDGVDAVIDSLDSGEMRLHDLAGREGPGANQSRELSRRLLPDSQELQ